MPLSYRRCTYSRKNEISAAALIRSFTVNAEGQHTSQSHLNPQTIWKLSWDARNLACSLHSTFLEIKWGQERMGYTRRTRLWFLSPHMSPSPCSWVLSHTHYFQAKIAFINEFRKLIWNNFFFNLKFCVCRLKLLFDTIRFPRISSATTPHSPSLTFEHGNM